MSDGSWVTAILGGVGGGIAAEWSRQRRVGRGLSPRAAARWSSLGGLGRWHLTRRLERGRTFEDRWEAATAAEVAALLRDHPRGRWRLWLARALSIAIIAIGVVWIAGGEVALGVVLIVCGIVASIEDLLRRRKHHRLAEAAAANRAIAARHELSPR